MISKLLKNKNNANAQKELEDLFSRPIKAMVVEEEPVKAEPIDQEAVKELEQEGDEELSAVQIKVMKSIRKHLKCLGKKR